MDAIKISFDSRFSEYDIADTCREVAKLIEEGYTNGVLANGATWEFE